MTVICLDTVEARSAQRLALTTMAEEENVRTESICVLSVFASSTYDVSAIVSASRTGSGSQMRWEGAGRVVSMVRNYG